MEINKPVAIIILIIITLAMVFLLAWPQYQALMDLKNRLVEKQAEYNGKSSYFKKISEVILEIESKKDSLEKIDNALPDRVSLAPIVYFLQKKGSETGLILKSIVFLQAASGFQRAANTANASLGDEAGTKQIKDIAFTAELLGNYQGLKDFISSLEGSSRVFEVDTISFSSQQFLPEAVQKKSQSEIYDFKLSLKTHTY